MQKIQIKNVLCLNDQNSIGKCQWNYGFEVKKINHNRSNFVNNNMFNINATCCFQIMEDFVPYRSVIIITTHKNLPKTIQYVHFEIKTNIPFLKYQTKKNQNIFGIRNMYQKHLKWPHGNNQNFIVAICLINLLFWNTTIPKSFISSPSSSF